jgi:hypothetical protein
MSEEESNLKELEAEGEAELAEANNHEAEAWKYREKNDSHEEK